MLITATVRTGNDSMGAATRSGPPVCGPCGMVARQQMLGDAQPFHVATGVIGVLAAMGLTFAILGFKSKRRR